MLNGVKGEDGCQSQLHETCSMYDEPKAKEKRILDRIIAHQYIIFENPSNTNIEAIRLKDSKNPDDKEDTPVKQQPAPCITTGL